MFCHKCGTQLEEKAVFCHKCGAKIHIKNVNKDISNSPVTIQKQQSNVLQESLPQEKYVIDKEKIEPTNRSDYSENNFKDFINNHVRTTTAYQSAEELLNSEVPQNFIFLWISCGVLAIWLFISFIRNPSFEFFLSAIIVYIFLFIFIVYPIALLIDFIRSFRVTGGEHKTAGSINADELILFLNRNLSYLSPYFNEWGYIKLVGYGVRGLAVASVQNALSGTKVGTEFGHKKSCFIEIHISPDHSKPDSCQTVYFFSTAIKSIWLVRYSCMIKSAPILEAAMEYYLREYKTEIRENQLP